VVQHAGGFILAGGAINTAYYLRILEDAELDQAGGNIRAETGGRFIMEAGSTLTFSGSDATYYYETQSYGSTIVRGTSAKHCTIHGADITHRMVYVYIRNGIIHKFRYLDIEFCSSGVAVYSYINSNSTPVYFYGCSFESSGSYEIKNNYDVLYFEKCTFGGASTVKAFYQSYYGYNILIDCTINQSANDDINQDNNTSMFVYNDITWTNATPSNVNNVTGVMYSSLSDIACKKFTVDEQNNLSECQFNVYHENYSDFRDINNETTNDNYIWMVIGIVNKMFEIMKNTDASGQAEIIVPYKFRYCDEVAGTENWFSLSESGGAYSHNGQYSLTLSKEGYRTQTTSYWGSSDQTWNVTLQEQADFDDILSCCNDTRDALYNRYEIDEDASQLVLYEDDGVTEKTRWNLTDKDGLPVRLQGTGPVNRGEET